MKKLLTMLVLLLMTTFAMAECRHTYDMLDVKMPNCETDGYYLLKCNDFGHTVRRLPTAVAGQRCAGGSADGR